MAAVRLRLRMVGARPLLPRKVGKAWLGARVVVGREARAVAAVGLVAAVVAGARGVEAVLWVGQPEQKAEASPAHLRPLLWGRRLRPRRPPLLLRRLRRRLRCRLQRRRLQRRQRHRRLSTA